MRVLLASQEFPPETAWGGIGTYAGIIAPALVRAGADVHVLSVVAGQRDVDRVLDGVQVHRRALRRPRGIGRALRLPHAWGRLSLAAAVAREHRRLGLEFDVCESPEWGAEGLFLAARRAPPVVVRLHSGAAQVFPYLGRTSVDRRLAIRCEERLIRTAQIVTGTPAQMASVTAVYKLLPDQRHTITYPVRVSQPLPPVSEPRVLFAGRFEARKGPDVLLRAASDVLSAVPETRFVLLGTDTGTHGDSYLESLRSLARELGVVDAVEIIERWGPQAVAEEMARAAVCAVPSLWESFGYVAAEAASMGRPVVASDIPSFAGAVEDGVTGRLVPIGDSVAWARALVQLLGDPAGARSMGLRGRDRMLERCHPDRVAAATLDAYEAAVSRAAV